MENNLGEVTLNDKSQIEEVQIEEAKIPLSNSPTAAGRDTVIRKLDYRILPLVLLFYTLSSLDRSNLGNAKLSGLGDSVNLDGNHYAFLGTAFYIGYIISQWAGAVGIKHFPAHIWVTCVIFLIGVVSTLQAVVTRYSSLVALRFLLGCSEGLYAGAPYYLSLFYPHDRVGLRQGIFLSGSASASAYSGLLGYAIGKIRGSISPWRYLFIVEGIPSCCACALAWLFLPDSIAGARFLSARDKELAAYFVPFDGNSVAKILQGF